MKEIVFLMKINQGYEKYTYKAAFPVTQKPAFFTQKNDQHANFSTSMQAGTHNTLKYVKGDHLVGYCEIWWSVTYNWETLDFQQKTNKRLSHASAQCGLANCNYQRYIMSYCLFGRNEAEQFKQFLHYNAAYVVERCLDYDTQ